MNRYIAYRDLKTHYCQNNGCGADTAGMKFCLECGKEVE